MPCLRCTPIIRSYNVGEVSGSRCGKERSGEGCCESIESDNKHHKSGDSGHRTTHAGNGQVDFWVNDLTIV